MNNIEKLKEFNHELLEIINNSWNGIAIINKEGKFLFTNQALVPILGYPLPKLVNKNFYSLMDDKSKKKLEELIQGHTNNKSTTRVEALRLDGTRIYLEISISVMENEETFVLNINDITKQISDDRIMEKYIASCHMDTDGIITGISDAFCELTQYTHDELIDKPYSFIFKNYHNGMHNIKEFLSSIGKDGEWCGQIDGINKSGDTIYSDIKLRQIHNKYGDITGYTTLIIDITHKKILKDQKEELITTVEHKDKSLQIISKTLQTIAHEWRQPINQISLEAQKHSIDYDLGLEITIKSMLDSLKNIENISNNLSSTIDDFRNFLEPSDSLVNINIKDIIDEITVLDEFKKQHIDINYEKDIPTINMYKNELSRVIKSIVENSCDAINKNNPANGQIVIKAYKGKNNYIHISILDNGGGIPKHILPNIFEPYFSTKEKKHGVGLGLYITKIFVDIHFKGSIDTTNKNDGILTTITLPTNLKI